jgi:hypothetical protein
MLITVMIEAARTCETSVNFYQTTRCNIPQDSHLQSQGNFLRRQQYLGFKKNEIRIQSADMTFLRISKDAWWLLVLVKNKPSTTTKKISYVGSEVLTAVSTKMAVFWVVPPCSLVDSTTLHGATTQKTAIFLR